MKPAALARLALALARLRFIPSATCPALRSRSFAFAGGRLPRNPSPNLICPASASTVNTSTGKFCGGFAPGGSFDYVSGCPLDTPSGAMSGSYRMVDEDGNAFDVAIPRFNLLSSVN